ncbi:NRDE family protein [Ulvibacter antarcticus]|uniref:Transport and Golgi organization protein 2 n=1 Tax=Ulvibacter antarcticus TaxID=442714 RepID=A0A3L9YBJ1_9FLAO|nr:NRDE family protein [Ulvibacter antarcticus]RMA57744.1 transport and Golgi organization protein 2 [Ulvibacter antarcticus]
MCTVTFIPKHSDGFVLTSNRDEAPGRKTLAPQFYHLKETGLLFPKDEVAGGTWFGVSSRKRLVCLMNGGFTAHKRADQYRMSRGIIVTDLLTSEVVTDAVSAYNYNGIEPFTVVLVDWEKELQLYELVWDGIKAHFSEQPIAPQIWSSSLLYSEEIKKKRERWFSEFIFKHLSPSEAELLNFHKTTGEGDINSNLIMDRGFVKTKSITQFIKGKESILRYEDLQSGETSEIRTPKDWFKKENSI